MPPAPVRVAFVGREVEHRHFTLTAPAGGIEPHFADHREGADLEQLHDRLRDLRPDVVVVFQPDLVPADGLDATTLAVVTDQLPSPWELDAWGPLREPPPEQPPPQDFDRVATTDPRWQKVPGWDVWRSPPLPVDDALFLADDRPAPEPLKPLFIGESTPYRERWLTDVKHRYELSHYAYGLTGERLKEALETHNVGVVLRRDTGLTGFPPEAALHLAAGHLLIAEHPLVPPRGLEPGLDHAGVFEPDQLFDVLYQLKTRPHAFEQARRRGRIRAEELRASRVWPRLIADLLADVAAYGRVA